MKKLVCSLLCIFIACTLVACGNSRADFTVKIVNASVEEIYAIEYTYYVNEKVIRSGGVCNADNTPFKKGEEFVLTDIPDSEEFDVELSVIDKNGKVYSCFSGVDLKNGEQYLIQINGDYVNGVGGRIIYDD